MSEELVLNGIEKAEKAFATTEFLRRHILRYLFLKDAHLETNLESFAEYCAIRLGIDMKQSNISRDIAWAEIEYIIHGTCYEPNAPQVLIPSDTPLDATRYKVTQEIAVSLRKLREPEAIKKAWENTMAIVEQEPVAPSNTQFAVMIGREVGARLPKEEKAQPATIPAKAPSKPVEPPVPVKAEDNPPHPADVIDYDAQDENGEYIYNLPTEEEEPDSPDIFEQPDEAEYDDPDFDNWLTCLDNAIVWLHNEEVEANDALRQNVIASLRAIALWVERN